MRRAAMFLMVVGMATTGCINGRSSQPDARPAGTHVADENVSTPAGKEFAYRGVHLVIPADWPVRNEHTLCPAFNDTGLFISDPPTEADGEPSCGSTSPPSDGVRIGPLVGYPPTPDGEAPIINGVRLAKLDFRGGVGYRSNGGFKEHSFWVLLPKPGVQLLFTYGSNVKSAEAMLASVSMDP
jgi:hypothetical protein